MKQECIQLLENTTAIRALLYLIDFGGEVAARLKWIPCTPSDASGHSQHRSMEAKDRTED